MSDEGIPSVGTAGSDEEFEPTTGRTSIKRGAKGGMEIKQTVGINDSEEAVRAMNKRAVAAFYELEAEIAYREAHEGAAPCMGEDI